VGVDDSMSADMTGRSSVQRALRHLFYRLGWRTIVVGAAAGVLITLATLAVALMWLGRYLEASWGETIRLFLIAVACAIGAIVVGVAWSWGELRTMRHMTSAAREGPARAADVWNVLVRAPLLIVKRCAMASGVFFCGLVVVVVTELDLPAYAVLPIAASIAISVAANVVLVVFLIEMMMRPPLEHLARYLPADFEPSARSWRLPTKAVAPLPVVTFFAALTVGAFVDVPAEGAARLSVALGVALVTVAVAAVIYLLVTRSVLDPIDALTAATRRVRAGDFSTPVPIVTADELGTLSYSFNAMLAGLREREALRGDLRHQAAELRESRTRIVAAGDAERRRVERDLHDGAQQDLVLASLKLALAQRTIETDPGAAVDMVGEVRSDLSHALEQLRDLAHGIYPALLVNDGLPAALADAVQRAAIPATVHCDGASRYAPELEAAVYFCCLEALQNAAKHAGPRSQARVRLAQADDLLLFEVSDDGRGCDARAARASGGLQNMADRVGAFGGRLEVESAPGHGTTVTGLIPVQG
jgi:signal transduction histidine kinase